MNKKNELDVFSIFPSIDGEVNQFHQGCQSIFIRLAGCSFYDKDKQKESHKRCSYCDTLYALEPHSGASMSIDEIIFKVISLGIKKVTITGGEPLRQKEALYELVKELHLKDYKISIETNGSYPVRLWPVNWVVDYKCPSSGAEKFMNPKAFLDLQPHDIIKYVIGSDEDFKAFELHRKWVKSNLIYPPLFAVAPVHDAYPVKKLLNNLQSSHIYDAIINVQIHKMLNLVED